MGESKVLEEILDKLFMGEWPWLVWIPLMAYFIPKVNSWSKGGCWALGVGGSWEQEGCAEWPGLPEEFLLQPGISWAPSSGTSSSRKNHPKNSDSTSGKAGKNRVAVQKAGLWSHTRSRCCWNSTQQEFLSCSPFPTCTLRKKHTWNAAEWYLLSPQRC